MAEKIVSPGVFTNENDLSFLPQGISQIGAAIIGPTAKGPAFIPTLVESYNDFITFFGDADGTSYVPYAVKNYLQNSGRATIVRVVGSEGYNSDSLTLQVALGTYSGSTLVTASNYGNKALFVLAPTTSTTALSGWSTTFATTSMDFSLSSGSVTYSLSYNPSSPNYVTNVFGNSAAGNKTFYVYDEFATTADSYYTFFSSTSSLYTSMSVATQTQGIALSGSGYYYAATPYIQSQVISGQKYDLFYFETFNCGEPDIKISIEDIKTPDEVINSTYGTFSVVVRQISDTDNRPNVIEVFSKCTLDPSSPNYISRIIGDQWREYTKDGDGNSKLIIHGDYTNNSKYIRVQTDQYIDTVPPNAIPFGFKTYSYPVKNVTNFPSLSVLTTQYDSTSGDWNYRQYLGFDFVSLDNSFVLDPMIATAGQTTAFSLQSCYFNSASVQVPFASFAKISDIDIRSRKFTVGLFGGYDALNPTTDKNMGLNITETNVMGFDCHNSTAWGTLAFRKGVDTVANPDEFDINMLVLPGLDMERHGAVLTYANTMCEDREDTFFLFDCVGVGTDKTVNDAVNSVSSIDSSYSATYYPWVKIFDTINNKYLWVPPSVVMAGVIAFNDRVSAEWYAPAGLNRGGITSAVAAYTRLTQADRDTLYDNRINPLATFVGQGVVAWGQKTLQVKASALDRINVRRLLIKIKKYIASTTKYLVFEQNTNTTRNKFLNIVNPYLDNIQQRQGLYTFKVVMDDTTNTPDVIDRNMMKGDIYLQPAKTAEMIVIGFNITQTGATFGA